MGNNTKKKTVLMICYYFTPCSTVGALRSEKFVKYLGQFDWYSVVLSAYRGGTGKYKDNLNVEIHSTFRWNLNLVVQALMTIGYFCINLFRKFKSFFKYRNQANNNKKSQAASSKAVGGLGIATYINRWLLLPDPQFLWIIVALPRALWLSRKCDVIYSSLSPYSAHVLAMIVKRITGKPWVADYRDEWSLNCRWNPATRFHRWLGDKLDLACMKNADRVVNVVQPSTEKCEELFKSAKEKFVTIYNGYDEEDIAPFRDREIPQAGLTFTTIGSLYGGRDIKPFLRAVAKAVQAGSLPKDKIKVKMIGGCPPDVLAEIEELGFLQVVEVLSRMPQQEAFDQLSQSHVALLVGSDMEKLAMTTKVYEYAGMGKPILALVPEGSVRDFVNTYGGWCVDCDKVAEISKIVANIFEQHKSSSLNVGCSKDFVAKYERRKLTGQMAGCFDSLIEDTFKKSWPYV